MKNNGFRRSEPINRDTLNAKLNHPPDYRVRGQRVSRMRGETVIADQEVIFLKVTSASDNPKRYGWKEVLQNKDTGDWSDSYRTGTADSDPAFEVNNATLQPGETIYRAERSRASGAWMIEQGSGGSLTATSNSIILLLGTYDQYKNCSEISGAGSPPRNAQGQLCGNYYAWAEYAVCGYRMKKIRDMRSFPYWASPLNNPEGGASGLRRLYSAFFGDPAGNCQGVRFDCGCSVSDLICQCPDWMTPVKCLSLKFRTIPRPCPANSPDPWCGFGNCSAVMQGMDDNAMWDKEFTVQLCSSVACNFMGTIGATGWGVDMHFLPAYTNTSDHCFWGPDWIDPCNPCEGFGEFSLSITSGDKRADCAAAGLVTGWLSDIQMKDLVTNCTSKKPTRTKQCNNCQTTPGSEFHPVIPESIELFCCDPKNQGTCP